ncbi:MAG: hypothetical protein ACREPJ_05290, partial [Rhodanobacteraceae bacterium]
TATHPKPGRRLEAAASRYLTLFGGLQVVANQQPIDFPSSTSIQTTFKRILGPKCQRALQFLRIRSLRFFQNVDFIGIVFTARMMLC